ncbi:MAG: hypothetical protein ACXIUM_06055 [Wenzhouxiangella sp.]
MHRLTIKVFVLLGLVLVLSACGGGPREVRGELPLITLEGLERQADQIHLQLGLRNVNDRPMPLGEVTLSLSVGGVPLTQLTHAPDFEIGARGREILNLRGAGLAEGLQRLDELEPQPGANSETPRSLAWQMQISLSDERGRSRDSEASGFLHPVPGQPGRFR